MLLALQLNPAISSFELDASANPIGVLGAAMLAEALPRVTKLSGLWLDEASRGPELAAELGAAATDAPPSNRRQSGVSVGGSPPGAGGGAASAAPGLGTLIVAALCSEGLVGLSRLSLAANPVPRPMELALALESLIVQRAGALHTLVLAGDAGRAALRLRGELPALLEVLAAAVEKAGGRRMRLLDVSHHQAGDGLVEAALPLLRGPHAPRALLLHGNGLGVSALERLGDAMQSDECTTETLVLAQEDVQGALAAELAAKRPKEMAHRRLRAAVEKVKSRIQP